MYVDFNYMPYALERKEDIKHSSVTAYTDNKGNYIVLHYSTVIFKLYKNGKNILTLQNTAKGQTGYSVLLPKCLT